MKECMIDKKSWSDGSAFMEVLDDGEIRVYGKFVFDDGFRRKNHVGPVLYVGKLPQNLEEEVISRGTWGAPMTEELEAFCREVWQKAIEEEPFFSHVK